MFIRNSLVIVTLVLLLTVSDFSQSALRIGSVAPQFSATSTDGTRYDMSTLRGKVVVLTFWSTRCPICRVEMPQLDRIVEQYDPRSVVFLAMTAENEDTVSRYLVRNPFRFSTIPDGFGTMLQYADRDGEGRINMPYPSFFVIDTQGRIQFRASGYGKTAALNSITQQLIARK